MFSFLKKKISEGLSQIKDFVTSRERLSEEDKKVVERLLLENNFSSQAATDILKSLSDINLKEISWVNAVHNILRAKISAAKKFEEKKCVVLVGINGAGKTTTAIKIARHYKNSLLIAADTFRAAAQDQLRELATLYDVPLYEEHGADPAAVVFRGCDFALTQNKKKIIIDTAGRIHQNNNLLKELQKIQKVAFSKVGAENCSTLIVLDSLQGKASIEQVKQFSSHISIDGIILTKLDSLSKPGHIFTLLDEYKIPIVYLTYGEHKDELKMFDTEEFINIIIEKAS